jgi:hypothetical protein
VKLGISDDSKVMQEESNGEVDYDKGPREYIDSSLGSIRDIKIQIANLLAFNHSWLSNNRY